MNFRTTILLLVVLAAVVGGMWLLGRTPASTDATTDAEPEPTPSDTKYIFDPQFDVDAIATVALQRPDEPTIVFERGPAKPGETADTWRLREPIAADAEGWTVRGLINALRAVQSRTAFAPGADGQPTAADAGLEPPTATVVLTDEDDQTYALEIGGQVTLSTDVYVRVPGEDTIHIANRDLRPQIRKKLGEFRAKQLLSLRVDEVVGLRIKDQERSYAFTRQSDGQWVIDEPVKAFADRDKLRSLITKLSTLRAEDFVNGAAASPAAYKLDPAHLVLEVATESKRAVPAPAETPASQPVQPRFETVTATRTLTVGGFADLGQEKRYVKSGDQEGVAVVPASAIEALQPNLKELRDPHLTHVNAPDATTVTLTLDGQTVTLKKVNGMWQGDGDLARLELPAVTDLLEAFEDLEAIDYVSEPRGAEAYGLDAPRARVTVSVAGAIDPVTVLVGNETPSGRNAYVQREGDTTVTVVPAPQAARLAVDVLSLRSRDIFDLAPERLERIEVARPPMTYELKRGTPGWQMESPAGAPVEAAAVRALANDLARLRGSRVVGKGNAAAFGLDEPELTVTFDVTDAPADAPPAATTHTLYVQHQDGTAYARRDDDPFVFELHDTVYGVLTGELIERRVFAFQPDEVTAVTVVHGDETLELARTDKGWTYVPDPYVSLAAERVNTLVQTLSGLQVEAYYAYGQGDLEAAGLLKPAAAVTVELASGRKQALHLVPEYAAGCPRKGGIVGTGHIFRLSQADCERLLRGLDDYVSEDLTNK
jgi:hypothetical protein